MGKDIKSDDKVVMEFTVQSFCPGQESFKTVRQMDKAWEHLLTLPVPASSRFSRLVRVD